MNLTFEQAIVFLPLLTALITFLLTSIFTLYKDKKKENYLSMIFFEYNEHELKYHFSASIYGDGKILFGENGRKLKYHAEKENGIIYSFLVIKNLTINNAINVKITHSFSGHKYNTQQKYIVTEEFFIPIWKYEDTLYLHETINNIKSHFSTNEKHIINYNQTH